ncbi:MAG: hypothetical protein LBF51_04565 [Zoogloeaceae bacterium]|jgi:hypothetical protein|nr:hypothetical protein [Zoogloeaceae bacterium]
MGSKKVTIGYIYYMGIHMGIARGPLDEINRITVGDKTAWSGSITGNTKIHINQPGLFGGDKKEGGINGYFYSLFGAPDQGVLGVLKNMLGGLVPAFRGVTTAFYDGEVCAMNPYPKAWAFRVRRTNNGWHGGQTWYPAKAAIWLEDGSIKAMNPAHILYQLYTDPAFGRGLPTARLDDASFKAAADTLAAEGFGLCIAWSRQDTIAAFAQMIVDHICATIYASQKTGLLTLKLIRDDYDIDTLPHFDADSGLLGIDEDESVAAADMTNEIVVKYTSPSDGKDRAVRVKNNAAIMSAGAVISQTREFPGIPTAALALRVAARELKSTASGVKRLKLRLDRRGAGLLPGDVFIISDAARGIGRLVLRATRRETGEGTDGTITVEAVQDMFGMPETHYVGVEPPGYVPPDVTPYPVTRQRTVESPYRFLAQLSDTAARALDVYSGFLTAIAAAPSPLSYGFDVWSKTGANAYALASTEQGAFCAVGELETAITPTQTSVTLVNPDDATGLFADFAPGGAALLGDEIVRVSTLSVNEAPAADPDDPPVVTVTLTLARGCADTVPTAHAAGTLCWLIEDCGGADEQEYISGATVSAKLLTVTPGGTLDINAAPASDLAITGRAGRPYPPGNFRVNGIAYPTAITGAMTISWSHRDRLTQADLLVDTTTGNIGPEPGTTYTLKLYDETGALARTETGLTGTSYEWETEDVDSGTAGDTALLHLDGDYTDDSGSVWTPGSGGVAFSASGKFGGCLDVKTTEYAYLRRTADTLRRSDFTIEGWVNVPTATVGVAVLYARTAGNLWGGEALLICPARGSGEGYLLKVSLYPYGADRVDFLNSGVNIVGSGWRHLALTRESDLWTLWLDGVAVASRTFVCDFTSGGYYDYVGASDLGNGRQCLTQIDEFRFTRGIARYTTNFTPPTAPATLQPRTLNTQARITLESVRDGLTSLQQHDWTVTRP